MINILMVDDHPSQIEAYKMILSFHTLKDELAISTASNCETAYSRIVIKKEHFDLVFVDLSLPGYAPQNIEGGEDLAAIIKKKLPNAKILILTTHAESFKIYHIFKTIDPAAFLIKSDFGGEELLAAFDEVLSGNHYYSDTVRNGIDDLLSKEGYLDTINRQIITLLSKGIKTKSIPDIVHISQSAIEKRKAHIKEFLDIEKGTDEDILREAKKRGYI